MSLQTDREAFAAALNTVDGVTAFAYPPDGGYRSGDAWPLVSDISYPNKFGGIVRWEIYVVLHSDIATAERLLDSKLPALRAALAPELAITTVTPRFLQFESGPALAVVVIAGSREEE
jgi:hypothetical protein